MGCGASLPAVPGNVLPLLDSAGKVLLEQETAVGTYEHDCENQNDYHFVTVTAEREGLQLRWSNRAGVSWMLTPRADGNFDVGEECPYYNNGHTVCIVVRNTDSVPGAGSVNSLLGPWSEAYDQVATITRGRGLGEATLSGQFKIKHTPIYRASGVFLSCHQTVLPGDKRGGDSQYVHVQAAFELRIPTKSLSLSCVCVARAHSATSKIGATSGRSRKWTPRPRRLLIWRW